MIDDVDAEQPLYASVTAARVNDITAAHEMPVEAGATWVFDLGYYDYAWWARLDAAGCRIVTRFKANTPLTVSAELDVPEDDGIKRRWAIELFFRWVKQTLRIRHFLGVSENAVRIQIAVALIAYLLLHLAQAAQNVVKSPLAFARLVRANLMHRKRIDRLIGPHHPPPKMLQSNRHTMGFSVNRTAAALVGRFVAGLGRPALRRRLFAP